VHFSRGTVEVSGMGNDEWMNEWMRVLCCVRVVSLLGVSCLLA